MLFRSEITESLCVSHQEEIVPVLHTLREMGVRTIIDDFGTGDSSFIALEQFPIDGLKIVYVDNEVEPDSRALHFYVGLANKIVHTNETADGHRFVTWRFKPGQRLQLQVPVEQWQDRIVFSVDAVAQDGPEAFVFQQNGDHFDRISVHVEHQDQLWTVIANDGSIRPGDVVATSGAHQLQMALKNKAGGGPDPHAGHNH